MKIAAPTAILLLTFTLGLMSPHAYSADEYGGYSPVARKATGYFRLETLNRRAYLITPSGHPFLALTVAHTSWGNTGNIPSEEIIRNLRSWGFNCVGYQSKPEMKTMLPWIDGLWIRGPRRAIPVGGKLVDAQYEYHDVFAPEVLQAIEAVIQDVCTKRRDDRLLVGYYLLDIPVWSLALARRQFQTDYPAFIKRLPADAPGKTAYVQFLRERYTNRIDALNTAYRTTFRSFDAVRTHAFAPLSVEGTAEHRDDLEFHGVIAEQYYASVARLVRKYDPNHLLFGDRFKFNQETQTFADESVIRAAGRHMDVLSVEPHFGGDFLRDRFDALHQTSGRPIMIGDHDVMGLPPDLAPAEYQARRGRAYAQFLGDALSTGYIVGYGKCMYFDRPGEPMPRGIVDADHRPRSDYVSLVSEANRQLLLRAYKAADGTAP